MISHKIPYVLYMTLLFGSACSAAPLTSTPSPCPRSQDSYGNSSTHELRNRLSHQRSTKSVVPIYKMLQHGRMPELLIQEPNYVEPRSPFRVDNANSARNFDMPNISSKDNDSLKKEERKLSRRDFDFRKLFLDYYNSLVRDPTPPPPVPPAAPSPAESSTQSSVLPTETEQANSSTFALPPQIPEPPPLTPNPLENLAESISSTGQSATAEATGTQDLPISIETASITATSNAVDEATQTADPAVDSTSVAAVVTSDAETTPSPTAPDQTSTDSNAQTTSSTVDDATSTTADVATASSTDTEVSPTATPLDQLQYWGGSMMVDPVNIYHIYYGNWSTTQRQIIDDFIINLPSTSYWSTILPTYKDSTGRTATTDATLQSSVVEEYSHGLVLDDQSVEDVISDVILSGRIGAPDPNGVYMLMTDKDVQQTSGFCETYCGYHDFFEVQGVQIKYGYMGDPTSCIVGCSPANPVKSPNNDPGIDSVVSILLHELIEIITDPIPPTGWIDGFGNENGDLCAYTYGAVKRLSSGAFFNQVLGGRNYLVQLMWAMDVNGCRS